MTAIEKFRAKFWSQVGERTTRLGVLLADVRDGDPHASTSLRELVHTMKGEAQLLTLEPCAMLLERSDVLLKGVEGGAFAEDALLAIESLRAALLELSGTSGAGEASDRAFLHVERAIASLGDRRS